MNPKYNEGTKLANVTIKQLLEAGVHFGHQTQRWNPKMKRFIFGERNGIYIINLEITMKYIKKAVALIEQITEAGQEILFVGTKKQAQDALKEAAESANMPFVNQRWLGGMLTNFETIRRSLKRIEDIDLMDQDGSFKYMTKKEVGSLKKEREKLNRNLAGIRTMHRVPGAIFVVDSKKEEIAIKEARKLKIPVFAILDTNCDPDLVDYPMPGNDDAIRAIKLFSNLVADAAKAGKDKYTKVKAEEAARKAKEEEERKAKEAEEAAKREAEKAKADEAQKAAVAAKAKEAPKEAPKKVEKKVASVEVKEAKAETATAVADDSTDDAKSEETKS